MDDPLSNHLVKTFLYFYIHSVIGNEDSICFYELHISVKDYCTFGDNRLIGVSVMQLKDIENQVIENKLIPKYTSKTTVCFRDLAKLNLPMVVRF
jgi:hypothetical protein